MTGSLAIIGGGISGTLVVLNCIKQCASPLKIFWFDAGNAFCKGFAYSTHREDHLLNVRAGNMSLFPDEPEHFVKWLSKNHPHYTAKDFVPRKLYGEYTLNTYHQLKSTNPFVKITELAQEVVSVKKMANGFSVNTDHEVEKIVLAIGNFLPAHPRSMDESFTVSENYFQNAFDVNLEAKAKTKAHITIIGSGLTMIDTVISLEKSGYKGSVTIISPHAYLPQPHVEQPLSSVKPFIDTNVHYDLIGLYKLVNSELKKAVKNALNLHSVIDVMRPHLPDLWYGLSLADKQQFMRHLRHKWGVARHRAPGQSMAVISRLRQDGRLSIIKGRIFNIKTDHTGFELQYTGNNNTESILKTDLLINCTGPESNPEKLDFPLIKQMLKSGIIAPDSLKNGLMADKTGQISANTFTLGPPLKGVLWECTAVPEIRVQAQKLASKIILD